jgi:putative ABC transport system permease protein
MGAGIVCRAWRHVNAIADTIRAVRGELRLAIRRLATEPALTIAAIATLALGIGACTAMFSIVEAVLLKPMDVAGSRQLMVLWPQVGDTAGEFTYSGYRELAQPSASFERVALTGSANWPIPTDILLPDGRRVRGTQCAVSDTFFDTLGARPLLGRTFQAGEDRPGAPLSLVVSAAFWKDRLGGDPAIVGKTLTIGPDRWTVIGVMPPEFFYPAGAELWTPAATLLALTADDRSPAGLQTLFDSVGAFHVVARLRPAVSTSQAQAEATGRWKRLPHTPADSAARVALTPFDDHVFGGARRALWILMGAVGLVLVLACANVAGLLVARNALRARELAVRRALGAGAWQLARQHLVETGVLAAAGGALAIVTTAAALRTLVALSPAAVIRLTETRVDAAVLAACLAITVAVTLGVGLFPAMQSRRAAVVTSLNALSSRDSGRSLRSDTRRLLVVVQVAITVTLLVASTLTWQSVRRLQALDLGFDPSNVLALDISRLDQSRYSTPASRHQAVEDLVNRLQQLPGVRSAAAVLNRPFAHGVIGWDGGLLLDGQVDADASWLTNPTVNFEAITPRYFESMGIRLRAGRSFSPADRIGTPLVAIVSENLAARLWPSQNPIGKRLLDAFGRGRNGQPSRWRTVVGVAGSARYRELERPRFDLYAPLAQLDDFNPEHVVVKTVTDSRALIPAAGAALSHVDAQLSAAEVTTMDDVVRQVRAPWRFNMRLFTAFGCMSIGLTVIGIAGLVVSTVAWRRREIGVRLALGAQARQVVSLIAVQGTGVIGLGVCLGVLCSLAASRLLSSLLFGVAATDPATLTAVAGAVLVLGALASYLPARRAAALDPASVFREP